MKITLKRTPEQVELIKAMASRNRNVAYEAQVALAEFIGPVLAEVINNAPTVSSLFQSLQFDADDNPSIPLDLYYDIADEDYVKVGSQSHAGGLPSSQVLPTVSELKVATYTLDSAVDFVVFRAVGGVGDGVGVGAAVDDAVNRVVGDAVDLLRSNGIKNASWHYWLGGQFWVGGWWGSPSFVSFFREVCGLELDQDIEERAEAYQKICESVNYIWLNSHFTMVCARPTEIHRDDQGRLHNENGLAIKYLDGWGLYAINGVTVSEQIVLRPETLTINQIQKESNQEKRRIMIERFGVDKYLQAINATIVDVDMRGVIGAGARALMKDDKGDCWFIGTDGSTDRVYNMYVGQGYTTCKEAHEALCGFSESLIKAEG